MRPAQTPGDRYTYTVRLPAILQTCHSNPHPNTVKKAPPAKTIDQNDSYVRTGICASGPASSNSQCPVSITLPPPLKTTIPSPCISVKRRVCCWKRFWGSLSDLCGISRGHKNHLFPHSQVTRYTFANGKDSRTILCRLNQHLTISCHLPGDHFRWRHRAPSLSQAATSRARCSMISSGSWL